MEKNYIWLSMTRTPADKREAKPTYPYFKVSLPPEDGEKEWRPVMACWQSKSGKPGVYSCKLEKGVTLDFYLNETTNTKESD